MTPADTLAPSGVARHAALLRLEIERRGELWVPGQGWSMWPTVQDGDEILLVRAPSRVRRGDVVLAVGTRLFLHRVLGARDGRLTTIGDAARQDDGVMETERVVARAVAARRGSRLVALEPTLRFGAAAFLWWCVARLRLAAARAWRAWGRRGRANSLSDS